VAFACIAWHEGRSTVLALTLTSAAAATDAPRAARILLTTTAALVAFASNSILCRVALSTGSIDPASFTSIRVSTGAAVLAVLAGASGERAAHLAGDWRSAGALVAYALAFSLAYVRLGAGIGALLLFGAVQVTIVGAALGAGERAVRAEWLGLSLALAGLVYLVAPGLTAPPVLASMLMVSAGVAWGVYTVRGRRIDDPLRATTGNFVRATPLALAAGATALLVQGGAVLSWSGVLLAAVSGGVTSALGYVVWYQALRGLTAMRAAVVQLAVPVLTALAATVFLDERITGRVVLAGAMILGGIGLTIVSRGRPRGGSR
jgi:drug/metabolite transporter (DMT)-like permease